MNKILILTLIFCYIKAQFSETVLLEHDESQQMEAAEGFTLCRDNSNLHRFVGSKIWLQQSEEVYNEVENTDTIVGADCVENYVAVWSASTLKVYNSDDHTNLVFNLASGFSGTKLVIIDKATLTVVYKDGSNANQVKTVTLNTSTNAEDSPATADALDVVDQILYYSPTHFIVGTFSTNDSKIKLYEYADLTQVTTLKSYSDQIHRMEYKNERLYVLTDDNGLEYLEIDASFYVLRTHLSESASYKYENFTVTQDNVVIAYYLSFDLFEWVWIIQLHYYSPEGELNTEQDINDEIDGDMAFIDSMNKLVYKADTDYLYYNIVTWAIDEEALIIVIVIIVCVSLGIIISILCACCRKKRRALQNQQNVVQMVPNQPVMVNTAQMQQMPMQPMGMQQQHTQMQGGMMMQPQMVQQQQVMY